MRPYHVELGGQGYLLELASYRKRAGDVFVPRQAVSTRYYADLRDVGVWAQTDWQGGRGATRWHEADPARFAAGGGLDTLTPHELRCAPRAVPVAAWAPDPPTRQVVGFVAYRGALFWVTVAGGQLTLWRAESEATAPARWSVGDTACGGLAVGHDGVWAGSGTSGQVYRWAAATGTFGPAFAVPDAQGVPALAAWVPPGRTAPLLYLGVRRAAGGQVYAWDGTTATLLLTLEGAEPTLLFAWDGRLYVAAADAGGQGALYRYDGTTWALVATLAENWVHSGAAFGAHYWLGSGRDNRVWRFDGRALVEGFAGLAPSGAPVRGLVAAQGRLYVGAAAEPGARSLLASATGADWHDLRPEGLTAAPTGLGVCALGVLHGAVYLAEELASGTGAQVYRLARGSAWNTAGDLVTARFDAALPGVDKAWQRCTVTHAPLGAGEGVVVSYRLDGAGGWQPLVTGAAAGSTRSVGAFGPGVVGRELALRVRLTSGGASTPQVKSVLVEYGLVPGVRREWEFVVLLEGTARVPLRRLDGTPEPRTGAELSAALWAARAAPGTVSFVDLDGTAYAVYFAELREEVAPLPQGAGWQTRARVRLVEA